QNRSFNMIKIISWKLLSSEKQKELLQRPCFQTKNEISSRVKAIINQVRNQGDKACIRMTREFDNTVIDQLQVTEDEIEYAIQQVSENTLNAMNRIIKQLTAFHLPQKLQSYKVETTKGVMCESLAIPLKKVGMYVP